MTEDWRNEALCVEVGLDLFFPEKDGDSGLTARKVCRMCPVVEACREYAIERFIRYGIWGDTSPKQRERIRAERGLREAA